MRETVSNDVAFSSKLIVESDQESLFEKEKLIRKYGVVSDRDIFTLDFYLSLHAIEKEGLRLVDDFYYLFLNQEKSDFRAQQLGISFLQLFPDVLSQSELLNGFMDFLKVQEEMSPKLLESLQGALKILQSVKESGVAPRSFSKLMLNELDLEGEVSLYQDHLQFLPELFQHRVREQNVNVIERPHLFWRNELELYEASKEKGLKFNFLNFTSEIEEVRFALEKMSQEQDILVLYPNRKGYETLFYLYQKEFFKNQVIYRKPREDYSRIKNLIDGIQQTALGVESYYNSKHQHPNLFKIAKVKNDVCKLEDVLEHKFDHLKNEEINFFSEVTKNFKSNFFLSLSDWGDVLTHHLKNQEAKFTEISSNMKLRSFKDPYVEQASEVLVLGWDHEMTRLKSESLIPAFYLKALERDLGLSFSSLYKTPAHRLFKQPIFYDNSVKKTICSSFATAKGGSKKPGLFKILSDKEKKTVKTTSFLKEEWNLQEREKLSYKKLSLSASSLSLYEQCPYKFYISKVIGLEPKEDLDYFLSPMEEGRLLHQALELLGKEREVSKKKFIDFIMQEAVTEIDDFNSTREILLQHLIEKLWHIFSEERKFIEDNKLSIKYVEEPFSFFFDLDKKSISLKEQGDGLIRGVVDRVDQSKTDEHIIYDYKRGGSGVSSLSRYKGGKLNAQLFLYCLAGELGVYGAPESFIGFQFIDLKEYKRTGGFVHKDYAKSEIIKSLPMGSSVTQDTYKEKMDLFLSSFWKVIEDINLQKFEAEPGAFFKEACSNCEWRGICKKATTFL